MSSEPKSAAPWLRPLVFLSLLPVAAFLLLATALTSLLAMGAALCLGAKGHVGSADPDAALREVMVGVSLGTFLIALTQGVTVRWVFRTLPSLRAAATTTANTTPVFGDAPRTTQNAPVTNPIACGGSSFIARLCWRSADRAAPGAASRRLG